MGSCLSAKGTQEDRPPPSQKPTKSPPVIEATPSNISNKKEEKLNLNGDDEEPVREEPIEDFYDMGKEIGKGGFSTVVEAKDKKTCQKCAIKCIKKTMVEGEDIKLLRREIKIMKRVSHPNILKLYEVFEDEDEFYLVMEL